MTAFEIAFTIFFLSSLFLSAKIQAKIQRLNRTKGCWEGETTLDKVWGTIILVVIFNFIILFLFLW